jgi:FdhD protein
MNQPDDHPDAMRAVRGERISTGRASGRAEEAPGPAGGASRPTAEAGVGPEEIHVVEEAPVTIDVEGIESYTALCTPADARALAAGFLLSEGVIDGLEGVAVIKECEDDPLTIRVRLKSKIPRIDDPGRNLVITSSCGACGSESLKSRIDALPCAGNALRIPAHLLPEVFGDLRSRQRLFQSCGATHAAAVFDAGGGIVSFAEDVGRHNALDKAIGKCLLAGAPTAGRGAAVTSRLSLEMVAKCARAGIELVAAVSAPTSLAIDVARNCNITLCAFVRERRATVFTHPGRVLRT